MPVPVSSQASIFLYSVLGGAIIAFLYDVLRIKRKTLRTNNIAVNIEDFLYWIIVSIVMFLVVFYGNDGEVRGFIFIGAFIGVTIYILLLSKLVMGVSLAVIRVVTRIIKVIIRILLYPVKVILKVLSIPAFFIFKLLRKAFRSLKRSGKNRISKINVWTRLLKNIKKKI